MTVATKTERLCPQCLENIDDGCESAIVHNGEISPNGRVYLDQVMHPDCALAYRDAYEITWPNGERTNEVLA